MYLYKCFVLGTRRKGFRDLSGAFEAQEHCPANKTDIPRLLRDHAAREQSKSFENTLKLIILRLVLPISVASLPKVSSLHF